MTRLMLQPERAKASASFGLMCSVCFSTIHFKLSQEWERWVSVGDRIQGKASLLGE